MKKVIPVISIMFLLCIGCSVSKNGIMNSSNYSSFKTLLEQHNLVLDTLLNFKEVPINSNSNVNYQYALKHDSLEFEIRFLITDINTKLDLPNDKRSLSFFTSVVLNASGNILPNIPVIQEFGQAIANADYNADWIAVSAFNANSAFSKGYSINSVIALRKNDNCEVYIFFLLNNKEKGAALVSELTTCLKFKG